MTHLWQTLFGPGTWGAGGNLVAWVLCGIPATLAALWHHRRQLRREFAALHARLDAQGRPGHGTGAPSGSMPGESNTGPASLPPSPPPPPDPTGRTPS